jgi:uncharacterized protein YjiS (DUF1127 family)
MHGLVTYWARREAIKLLGEMDRPALRDIGIVRSQIEAAVGGELNPGWRVGAEPRGPTL